MITELIRPGHSITSPFYTDFVYKQAQCFYRLKQVKLCILLKLLFGAEVSEQLNSAFRVVVARRV